MFPLLCIFYPNMTRNTIRHLFQRCSIFLNLNLPRDCSCSSIRRQYVKRNLMINCIRSNFLRDPGELLSNFCLICNGRGQLRTQKIRGHTGQLKKVINDRSTCTFCNYFNLRTTRSIPGEEKGSINAHH